MRTIRRETGGYALLYVLIVVLVLCAGAMAICTVALRGYQGQIRSVEQTQQLYQAEGEIEKFVALASDVSGLAEAGPENSQDAAKQEALDAYKLELQTAASGITYTPSGESEGTDTFEFTAVYENADVRITAQVSMELEYETRSVIIPPAEEGGEEDEEHYAKIRSATPTYLTYDISHDTEGEDTP